jgi:hypothetical protein
MTEVDPRIDKRRVTCRSIVAVPGGTAEMTATDYVRDRYIEAYVADARERWQFVEVSEEYDAGPGGYDGATYVPEGLAVADAGTFYPATEA